MSDSPFNHTPRTSLIAPETETIDLASLDLERTLSARSTKNLLRELHHVRAEDRTADQIRLLLTTLKNWWVIGEAPPQVQTSLCRLVSVEEVPSETRIFHEGQSVRRSYFIYEGEVQVKTYFNLPQTDSQSTASHPFRMTPLSSGDFFGEMAGPRDHAPRASDVVAKTDCILLSIEHQEYWRMVQGIKEGDEAKRKLLLLRSMFPSAEPDENEKDMIRREEDLRRMAAMLKLHTVRAGELLAAQGSEISDLFFIVSGECDLIVDVNLSEIYPGALSRNSGEKQRLGDLDRLAGDERLATRIQLSTVQSPRQLGTTKRSKFTVSRLFRGDILGDEHVWGEESIWKFSAAAVRDMEVGMMDTRSWQFLPSRFLPSLYDSSKLKTEDRQSVLSKLLRLERQVGWKLSTPIGEVFAKMPEKRPTFTASNAPSKSSHKARHLHGHPSEAEGSVTERDSSSKRRIMFFYAASNSTTSNYIQSKKKRTYGLDEQSFLDPEIPHIAADLLFGGRGDLLEGPQSARPSTSPGSRIHSDENPFEHPRRPATARTAAPTIQDMMAQAKRPPWVFGDKPVLRPRNASVSANPFHRDKISERPSSRVAKKLTVPRMVSLRPLPDSAGATLEVTETLTSRGAAFTPRPSSQRKRNQQPSSQ